MTGPLEREVPSGSDRPATLKPSLAAGFVGRDDAPLVQILVPCEQRARTSQAYVRSAVGDRLRSTGHRIVAADDHDRLEVTQVDATTGLVAVTIISRPSGIEAYRVETTIRNDGDRPITISAVGSLTIGIGRSETDIARASLGSARSEWLAENRWTTVPLVDALPPLTLGLHGQDGRGRFAVTSHGSWSTGEFLSTGFVVADDGAAVAWEIESTGPWLWELTQGRSGASLTLMGPTEQEHGFTVQLAPGDTFTAVPAAIAVSEAGRDGALAELTRYRRWLRRRHSAGDDLPIVYNDFMNTLMGDPSTEALEPLIHSAADAGVDVYCIDAGWYADADEDDWWPGVGEWHEGRGRFRNGLRGILATIHDAGLRSGIWLEPEGVGIRSPVAERLPDDAFFSRHGVRVQEDRRYHLDFRSRAARDHVDAVVDRLVGLGISYFKLDYNINPGAGTDLGVVSAAEGLLEHGRAYTAWIESVRRRHPHVSIENCGSGGMRADAGLLAVTQLQSTSDQQDFLRYPPIAASAPASIVPEQCGNWAYPSSAMTLDETAFTLVTGLAGRLYLSGFLDRLSEEQRDLVRAAVALHRSWREWLGRAEPFWPIGMPRWSDDVIVLGLTDAVTTRLFAWNRGSAPAVLPIAAATVLFPARGGALESADGGVLLPAGPVALVLEVAGDRRYCLHER